MNNIPVVQLHVEMPLDVMNRLHKFLPERGGAKSAIIRALLILYIKYMEEDGLNAITKSSNKVANKTCIHCGNLT